LKFDVNLEASDCRLSDDDQIHLVGLLPSDLRYPCWAYSWQSEITPLSHLIADLNRLNLRHGYLSDLSGVPTS
jgi:hypothetical protein